MFTPARVILGIEESEVLASNVMPILALSNWTSKEIQRINKVFESTTVKPSEEELQAGIKELNFGMFGILDYYARRMGVADHEEVENVPWVRIYKCMDMDAQKMRYEKRLRDIYSRKK